MPGVSTYSAAMLESAIAVGAPLPIVASTQLLSTLTSLSLSPSRLDFGTDGQDVGGVEMLEGEVISK